MSPEVIAQLDAIKVNMNEADKDALTRSLFSDEYLLERPLLQSIRSEKPVVLLIDEIDKADEEELIRSFKSINNIFVKMEARNA